MERRISHGRIINNNSAKEEIFKKYNKDYIDECKDCEFRYACYDCRPDSASRSITAKPWYCTYDQKSGTFMEIESVAKLLNIIP